MKKLMIISIFIFLSGTFAGMFFSNNISAENSSHLSSLMLSTINENSEGFFALFFSSLFSNLIPAVLMISAIGIRILCPLPFCILWYKSFAVGFCSSLIFLSEAASPLKLSLFNIIPQNLFFVPATIILATLTFNCSYHELLRSKRPARETRGLKQTILLCICAIVLGCLIQSIFGLISV